MTSRSLVPDFPRYLSVPFALGGFALLCLTVAGSSVLTLGTMPARFCVGALLLLICALGLFLLYREGCPSATVFALLLPLAAVLYLRLLCLDHQTHDYYTFLAKWAAFFRENGGFSALSLSVGDYNVPYLYFLAAISYIDIPDLYLIKLFSILFDVLMAWAGMRLCRTLCRDSSPAPVICFLLMLWLPTFTLNGAYWGQCDSMYVFFILLAFYAVMEGRPKASVFLLSLAFSLKLQTVFLIPLWCVFLFARRVKFRHLFIFPAGYALTILPALLMGRPLLDILSIYVSQTTEYNHRLVLNAATAYAFIPYYAEVNEKLFALLGIILAFLLVFFVLGVLFFNRKKMTQEHFLAAATVMAIGVPFLLPHMHERYFYLAGAVSLVWACCNRKRVPIALLTEISSLSCYCTYLRLKYTLPFRFAGMYFVMAFEAAVMLAALVWSICVFLRQIRQEGPSKPLSNQNFST